MKDEELLQRVGRGRPPKALEEVEFNRAVGERMERLRVKARVSQAEMAKALGIGKQRLYWYECGRTSIPAFHLARFAAQIDVSVDVLCKHKSIKCVSRLTIQKTLLDS